MPSHHTPRLGEFAQPSADPGARREPAALEPPAALSVSEVVQRAKGLLQKDEVLRDVWVRGEVTGFKPHSSGHWYFSIKDNAAALSCVMWRAANARIRFTPEDGMEVLLRGKFDVYAPRGQMQFSATDVQPVGAGALAIAFEQLRRKLDAEGLFAPDRKRPLPQFPRTVGVVTSLTGAALRDIVHVATRRWSGVRILVAGARVQGEGAATEIADAIARLNAEGSADVLIVGRGGGSIEDLWAFNEELVVRAVVASRIPVVSAVGHETDFTLTDFAADARAATPSAAAETIVPDAEATLAWIDEARERIAASLARLVPDMRQRIDEFTTRAGKAAARQVERERQLLARLAAHLHALSPLAVLGRGYAVALRDGRVVRSVDAAPVGTDVDVVLADGTLEARVTRQRKEDRHANPES